MQVVSGANARGFSRIRLSEHRDAIAMLNPLRFRPVADYSVTPELAPVGPITGEAAYEM